MSFEYSCFVSYRHGRKRLMTSFIEQLIAALEAYVEPYVDLPVFHDVDGLYGGDLYDREFARVLCRSVCMIAVYTPTYFDRQRTYCAREYRGMEIVEERRFGRINDERVKTRGLIIPIVLKGVPPPYVTTRRAIKYDFSQFTLRSDDLSKHELYAEWFDEIGQCIWALHQGLTAEPESIAAASPDNFALPEDPELEPILNEIIPRVQPTFPGRLPPQLIENRIDGR